MTIAARPPRRSGNKTAQVCSLVERAVSLSLGAGFEDPVLLALRVVRVLPDPDLSRLLVVLELPLRERRTIEEALTALEQVKGRLRGDLAQELNRKRTPNLAFLVQHELGVEQEHRVVETGDMNPTQTEPRADDTVSANLSVPSSPPIARRAAASAATWAPKRERARNGKRELRRAAKLAERRGETPKAPTPALCVTTQAPGAAPIKRWTQGVPVEDTALRQLDNVARLPFIHQWVAAMPDVHFGIGATVGSVIATVGAVIPAAVGVDIGCGMMAVRTTLAARDLPDQLGRLRAGIEQAVPHGRSNDGRRGDAGAWSEVPPEIALSWKQLEPGFKRLASKHPAVERANHAIHLGTLGTGNHFIELCLDEADRVWVMLHSGSRGVGSRIGNHFIGLAKQDMTRHLGSLPDQDLAYFSEGSEHFADYLDAVGWAQDYARTNRELMMKAVLRVLRDAPELPPFETDLAAINCHHNYVAREHHYGKDVLVTRKGAVRAGVAELGIIPGSMGTRSFIVSGKGNPESFCSCSHGAGRKMSRGEAKRRFTTSDHARMTAGVECRKDKDVIDETPGAYKDIDAVMTAQRDLISVEHTLKQVLCVKG